MRKLSKAGRIALILAVTVKTAEVTADQGSAHPMDRNDGGELMRMIVEGHADNRRLALEQIREQERTDLIAPMITLMRFVGPFALELGGVMDDLTGQQNRADWAAWMEWQETNPDIAPFAGYDTFKADLMARIDPNFRLFLYPGMQHTIRLEEITWGGVVKDGIPALNDPLHINAEEADYMLDDDLVFGVSINGDARAYPLRIMDWHEMFNDVVGGVPVALAYCTLCGSGILYETGTSAEDRINFGSSGFLYRSNKLMYDQTTHSLWNQFTGRPVTGELAGKEIDLQLRPVVITSWEQWRATHPETRILSLDTGHDRDYGSGVAYAEYWASPELMFPNAAQHDDRLAAKEHVFVMRTPDSESARSWPLSLFTENSVIHGVFEGEPVILIGDAATRTVRAYQGNGDTFSQEDARMFRSDDETWQQTEDALIGESGTTLARLPGHMAFWFAPAGFLPEAELGVRE